jgi:hypothetical protein
MYSNVPSKQDDSAGSPGQSKWAQGIQIGSQILSAAGQAGMFGSQQRANKQSLALQKDQQRWGQELDKVNTQRTLDQDAYQRANQNMTNPARMKLANAMMQRLGLGDAFQAPVGGFQPQAPAVAQQVTNPMMDKQARDQEWAKDAMFATPSGRIGGKQVYTSSRTGKTYTNDDRNHAQKEIIDRYGMVPQTAVTFGQYKPPAVTTPPFMPRG